MHCFSLFRIVLAAAWASLAPIAGAAPQDSMAQRMQACSSCHGAEGRATREGYFPRIAGKPAAYLYQQLLNFRDGRRHNGAMVELMSPLTDAYLHEIADYFAGLQLPYPPTPPSRASGAQLRRGEQLVRAGDAARRLPACSACHGEQLQGRLQALPGLRGLPPDYLIGQIGAWRTGLRRAVAPDCMGQIANQLAPEDVAAVAMWIAAQPVEGAMAPEAPSAAPLPINCAGGQ